MSFSVNVSGISPSTNDSQLRDFFTITSVEHHGSTAVISFEKSASAKTALMLNGGTLDGATLSVLSDTDHQDSEDTSSPDHPLDQSDKPRAGIAAEYLARGYTLSDNVLQRAIEMDRERGISTRFLNYFSSLDKTVGARALGPDQTLSGKVQTTVGQAAEQAKQIDAQKGYSKIAQDYYVKAISSPFGQRVTAFYTNTSKQIMDIHEEARRIADQHKEPATQTTEAAPPAAAAPTQEKIPVKN
ncbi:hypothetical protein D9619_007022 [Psilocybe cf. subviscida]|uniref:RRM domain-containing protein n=1 Tax=Psilocybe cf. subviscida TaxID=2480587 RepID=A0A8H5B299_9AGAR|nr:hypothetical protein D9619_007022 [Psilocybe cf. subviscida]